MMKMLATTMTAVAATTVLTATGVAAQEREDTAADTLPRYEVEGVTVTTRRSSAVRHDLPQKVDVATSADLERTVGTELTDALKETLGLDVIQYPGLLAGVSVRGFRPQFSGLGTRTLILVDGRPAGATNLAMLEPSAFQRIEVLKGPASALYGSSAMGGVVNLVSRRSTGPVGGRVSGSYGSFGSYRAEAAVGGSVSSSLDFDLLVASSGREGGYRVGANRLLGGDSITKILDQGDVIRIAEVSPDSTITFSDYATRSGSLRVGYALTDGWRAGARVAYFAADAVQNPGDLVAGWGHTLNDLERRTADASISGDAGVHSLSARAFASRESTVYYDDPFDPAFVSSRSPTTTRGLQIQDVVTIGRHSMTAGVDHTVGRSESERYEVEAVQSPPYAPNSEIRSTAVFAEAVADLFAGRAVATLGGRLDRVAFQVDEGEIWDYVNWTSAAVPGNTETRNVFNPSAGLLFRIGAGVAAHASGGRAFVTPDPFYVAGYSEARPAGRRAVHVTQGNPGLHPESSVSWDGGITITRPDLSLEADFTYFSTSVRDRVVATALQVDGVRLTAAGDTILGVISYENADRARIRGLEGRLSYDIGARAGLRQSLRLFGNATRLLRAEEVTGDTRRRVRNVADLTLVGGLDFDDLERFGATLSGRYVGERRDADFSDWMNPGEVVYPAFLTVDLSARLRVRDRFLVSATVDNLTDQNYYEVRGYNLPGRAFRLGLAMEL